MKCLHEERLFALVEGAAAEQDAKLWQEHVDGCERCRKALKTMKGALEAIAAEEPLDVTAHADAVMASLDRAPAKRQPLFMPLALSGLALAAALMLGLGFGRSTKPADPGEFTARGGSSASSLQRDVGVEILGTHGPLHENETIERPSFTARARNLGNTNVRALVFLVDSKHEVHWLYPAFTDPQSNPASITIPPAKDPQPLGDGVTFSDLAPGPASLVTVITQNPLTVSRIEGLQDNSPSAIQRAFPEADVRVLSVRVP